MSLFDFGILRYDSVAFGIVHILTLGYVVDITIVEVTCISMVCYYREFLLGCLRRVKEKDSTELTSGAAFFEPFHLVNLMCASGDTITPNKAAK